MKIELDSEEVHLEAVTGRVDSDKDRMLRIPVTVKGRSVELKARLEVSMDACEFYVVVPKRPRKKKKGGSGYTDRF